MTILEDVVFGNKKFSSIPMSASKKEVQMVLDEITKDVMEELSPEDISAHTREVYNDTIEEYTKNSHNTHVVDELIEFMSLLPTYSRVLDMGCGTGRDVLFMSVADATFRNALMGRLRNGATTREKYSVPTKTFDVVGIDNSSAMVHLAQKWESTLIAQKMLSTSRYPRFLHRDISALSGMGMFDGIWSCAALFTHTPKEHLAIRMHAVSKVIKRGGYFYVTYTNASPNDAYDKLLLSSTGRIKYFSHPNPHKIAQFAQHHGFILESERLSDMEVDGKVVVKDLFVSQQYRKI